MIYFQFLGTDVQKFNFQRVWRIGVKQSGIDELFSLKKNVEKFKFKKKKKNSNIMKYHSIKNLFSIKMLEVIGILIESLIILDRSCQ